MDANVKAVLSELTKPQNIDLLVAVMKVGDGSTDIESFMGGFTVNEAMSFDEFVLIENKINFELGPQLGFESEDTPNMSKRYDEYLLKNAERNSQVELNENQTTRFEAIIDKYDTDGWSGAYYGFVMRSVQVHARLLNSN